MLPKFLQNILKSSPQMLEKLETGWFCNLCHVYFRDIDLEKHIKEEHMQ